MSKRGGSNPRFIQVISQDTDTGVSGMSLLVRTIRYNPSFLATVFTSQPKTDRAAPTTRLKVNVAHPPLSSGNYNYMKKYMLRILIKKFNGVLAWPNKSALASLYFAAF